ncbi:MAG TPA: phosphonate C-P lyase system protein PhnH [Pseudonocardia sp.]|nr:phosphonate C-P lyase system protein PhnH [Pseudonocardia sp.]
MTATATDPTVLSPAAALSPAVSRRVFRAVLDALARPGEPARLPVPAAEPPRSGSPSDAMSSATQPPAVLVPILALADLGTGIHVLDRLEAPTSWADALATATSAPVVPLERARLVGALRPVTPAEVGALCRGSALAPEEAALLAVPVADLAGGPVRWVLSGPGVPGRAAIAPSGVPAGFLAARAAAVHRYPTGIDVLLVAPDGRLLGLPRGTRVEEEN